MTANPIRGEVSVQMEGEDYVLRPTYDAITAVEEQTGRSIQQLALAADEGSLPLRHAAIVVTEFVKAWGRENDKPYFAQFTVRRIAELLFAEGLLKVNPRVALALWQALTGGHVPGEANAAGTTTTTTTTTDGTPAAD